MKVVAADLVTREGDLAAAAGAPGVPWPGLVLQRRGLGSQAVPGRRARHERLTPRSSEIPAASRSHWGVGRPLMRHCSPVFRQN